MKHRHDKERIARAVRDFQRGIHREKSFRILYDEYYGVIQGFFAQRVFSPEDRLDLTQELFLRVYRGLKGFRREADFGTWLFRIAFNTHLKWRRRQKADPVDGAVADGAGNEPKAASWETAELVAVSPRATPLDETQRQERSRELRHAIEELPEKMRECTLLRIYQDLNYREVAVVMKLSIETVKVHLFQARKKLKKSLLEKTLQEP